VSKNKL